MNPPPEQKDDGDPLNNHDIAPETWWGRLLLGLGWGLVFGILSAYTARTPGEALVQGLIGSIIAGLIGALFGRRFFNVFIRWFSALVLLSTLTLHAQVSPEQLASALKKYPEADTNKDGVLSVEEALAYRASRQKAQPTPDPSRIPPTIADGHYAEDPACVFDFWKARTDAPAPLFLYIHGGGFVGGSKDRIGSGAVRDALDRGYAVMSIGYPFLNQLPIQKILPTCARAVQYARHHAAEWGLDPQRIYLIGSSAGAGTSLWIATHPDLADPKSTDPVARESTRIQGAAMVNGQATYNVARWGELIGPSQNSWQKSPTEDLEFYHFKSQEEFDSPSGQAARQEVDMLALLDAATPPLFLYCNTKVGPQMNRGAYIHHPKHAEVIAEKAKALGVPCQILIGPDAEKVNSTRAALDFFDAHGALKSTR